MASVTMRELLEAGVHFGHRTRRWNPKMRPFIFTERSGVHIIDLQQTMLRVNKFADMASQMAANGKTILFVGTKRQAQATVNLSKKEQLSIDRQVAKLNYRLGGLKTMTKVPDMLFVVDTHLEDLAIREATKVHIPILGMVDTNTNPDAINHVIPSNDDAIRAIKLIVTVMANAIEEGLNIREIDHADTGKVSQNELAAMEQYLGPSTLAKLQTSEGEEAAIEDDSADSGSSNSEPSNSEPSNSEPNNGDTVNNVMESTEELGLDLESAMSMIDNSDG